MASSPAAARTTTARPPAPIKVPGSSPLVLIADVVSYGYAFVVVLATLQLGLEFTMVQAVLIMCVFVALRGVAHEIRKDARRAAMRDARRLATLRSQSPARWSAEQRDGLGRRIDTGA